MKSGQIAVGKPENAVPVTLAGAHGQFPGNPVDIGDLEIQGLAYPETQVKEHREHGVVAHTGRCLPVWRSQQSGLLLLG